MFKLDETDAAFVGAKLLNINSSLLLLGRLRADYLKHEQEVLQRVEAERSAYQQAINLMMTKYLKDQKEGRYVFRPDLGAFVSEE